MTQSHFILLDATLESQAPFFDQNPIFQPWLRSYDNVRDALQFISQINAPGSIEVYIARDNIFDNGLPSDTNGPTRTLIQTFSELNTISHVTIFCPTISTDLEQQTRTIVGDPRLIKDVISVINLHSYMCLQGISYFQQQICRCLAEKEAHLIPNLRRNINELVEYLNTIIEKQREVCEVLEEAHSNRLSEETL